MEFYHSLFSKVNHDREWKLLLLDEGHQISLRQPEVEHVSGRIHDDVLLLPSHLERLGPEVQLDHVRIRLLRNEQLEGLEQRHQLGWLLWGCYLVDLIANVGWDVHELVRSN